MSFKASNIVPAKAYDGVKLEALRIKTFADRNVILLSSVFSANNLSGTVATLAQQKAVLNNLKSTPGLAQYAKDQESDQAYDVVVEFVSLLALIDAVIAEIKITSTDTLIDSWGANGIVWNTFTPAQTATLKTKFQALSNGIS